MSTSSGCQNTSEDGNELRVDVDILLLLRALSGEW